MVIEGLIIAGILSLIKRGCERLIDDDDTQQRQRSTAKAKKLSAADEAQMRRELHQHKIDRVGF